MKIKSLLLAAAVCGVLATTSCSRSNTVLPYFTDIESQNYVQFPAADYQPVIQPDDELSITVSSAVPGATVMYNLPMASTNQNNDFLKQPQLQQQSYVVDSQGNITMPVIGKLHVAGLTVDQLQKEVEKEVAKTVKDPVVIVRLLNGTVSIGGEVRSPKTITMNRNRMTILDALAASGDLTEYGERSNVLVYREKDGKREVARIDLNSSDVFTSPYFYLQPNDYVYVAPNNVRQQNSKYNTNNAYKLQVASIIVSTASVIASLVIALTVK